MKLPTMIHAVSMWCKSYFVNSSTARASVYGATAINSPIAAAADVFGKVGKIILAIVLILACVVALLIGACFVLIAGSGIR